MRIGAGVSLLNNTSAEMQLNLPSKMDLLSNMHSTSGMLIECMYSVNVTAHMEGTCMCCGENPAVQNIMKIIPNAIMAPSAPVAPPNWHPSMLEPVTVQYDTRFEASAPLQ